MKQYIAAALLSTCYATSPQENVDTLVGAATTGDMNQYQNMNRVGGSHDAPPICPVRCQWKSINEDGSVDNTHNVQGRDVTIMWDSNALSALGNSGWKCGLEVANTGDCTCECGHDTKQVTTARSCYSNWAKTVPRHILRTARNNANDVYIHTKPDGTEDTGFSDSADVCAHQDGTGNGAMWMRHTLADNLSSSRTGVNPATILQTFGDYAVNADKTGTASIIDNSFFLPSGDWTFSAKVTAQSTGDAQIWDRHKSGCNCGPMSVVIKDQRFSAVRGCWSDTGRIISSNTITAGQTYDVELQNVGNTMTLLVDGVAQGTAAITQADTAAYACARDSVDGGGDIPWMIGAHYWNINYHSWLGSNHYGLAPFDGTITDAIISEPI